MIIRNLNFIKNLFMIILKLIPKLFVFQRGQTSTVFLVPFTAHVTSDSSLPTLASNLLTIRSQTPQNFHSMRSRKFHFWKFSIYQFSIIVSLLLLTFLLRTSFIDKLNLNFFDHPPKIILFKIFHQKHERIFWEPLLFFSLYLALSFPFPIFLYEAFNK